MSKCAFSLFPYGALGRELIDLALIYIGHTSYSIEQDKIIIHDPKEFAEFAKGLVDSLKRDYRKTGKKAQMYTTINDLKSRNCFPKLYDYLGLSSDSDHLDIVDRAMDILANGECNMKLWNDLYTTPQLFKINYFKYAKQGFLSRLTDKEYPHRYINGFSFILSILGYFLSLVTRTREKLYLLLHTDVFSLIPEQQYKEIHKLSKQVALMIRNEAPEAIISLNLAITLISKGVVRDLSTGRLLVIQVKGQRSTLLTINDLNTHGLVRLLAGNTELVKHLRILVESVLNARWDKPDPYSSFVAFIANKLLLYANTCSNEIVYSITSSLRRFGDHYRYESGLPEIAIIAAGKLKGLLENIGEKRISGYFYRLSREISELAQYCPLEDIVYV